MRTYKDDWYHKGLRKQLVEQLRSKGITDDRVLNAINTIPRHFFLDSAFDKIAYEDRAFPIAEGQTISQPYTVAYQTQLLQVKRNDKVLEIGTGSMYQAVVLAEMGARPVATATAAKINPRRCIEPPSVFERTLFHYSLPGNGEISLRICSFSCVPQSPPDYPQAGDNASAANSDPAASANDVFSRMATAPARTWSNTRRIAQVASS